MIPLGDALIHELEEDFHQGKKKKKKTFQSQPMKAFQKQIKLKMFKFNITNLTNLNKQLPKTKGE